MKKLKIIQISMMLIALCFCTSCSGSKQMPNDLLKTAIQNEDGNYGEYGLELKDFSVKDRNYDSNYKTESVTVEVRQKMRILPMKWRMPLWAVARMATGM